MACKAKKSCRGTTARMFGTTNQILKTPNCKPGMLKPAKLEVELTRNMVEFMGE